MAVRRAGDRGEQCDTVIGAGSVLEGTFSIERDLRIDGTLHGRCLSVGKRLVVGKSGDVEASVIEAGEAVISGKVVGALSVRRQVRLEAGARFRGILRTPRLVIEEGAELREDRSVEQEEEEKDP